MIKPKAIPTIYGALSQDLTLAGLGGATFTRSTTATFTDYEGVLQTAAINESRFEGGRRISEGVWSNTKPDGSPIVPTPKLLMEGQSTNYFLNSGTPASHTSPTCPAGKYTMWLAGTGSVAVAAGTAVGTGWGTATASTPLVVTITTGGTVAFTVTGTVTIAQFEPLPVKSSYIPTTTSAVTRTADALSWPLSTELQAMLSIDKAWTTSLANQTGLTWGAEKNQSSFADGQAWFDHPDKDLSTFANSGRMMILRDSSGRLAWGFIGAAGTGQTLGSSLAGDTGFDNAENWLIGTGWAISSSKATATDAPVGQSVGKVISPTLTKLYCLQCTCDSISSGSFALKMNGANLRTYFSAGTYTNYRVHTSTSTVFINTLSTLSAVFDNFYVQEVLTPSAKGVYIYKDAARTLQGWNMEASFNMNDASYTFDVVADCKAEGTVVLDWVPGYIPPASQIGIISSNAAVDSMLSVASGASVSRAYDTTTAISGGATLVAGTQRKLVLQWSSLTRQYQISSIASGTITHGTAGSFDGAFTLGANLLLHYSNAYPAKYGNFKTFPRWLNDSELSRL